MRGRRRHGIDGIRVGQTARRIGLAHQQIGHSFETTLPWIADPHAGIHTVVIKPANLHRKGGIEQHDGLGELAGILDHLQQVLLVLMQTQSTDALRILHHHLLVFTAFTGKHDDGDIVVIVLPAGLELIGIERCRLLAKHRGVIQRAIRTWIAGNLQVIAGHTLGIALRIGFKQSVVHRETGMFQCGFQINHIFAGVGGTVGATRTIDRLHHGVAEQRDMFV